MEEISLQIRKQSAVQSARQRKKQKNEQGRAKKKRKARRCRVPETRARQEKHRQNARKAEQIKKEIERRQSNNQAGSECNVRRKKRSDMQEPRANRTNATTNGCTKLRLSAARARRPCCCLFLFGFHLLQQLSSRIPTTGGA